jgi:sugar phosphate isomerase/epimerase
MTTRRDFIKNSLLSASVMAFGASDLFANKNKAQVGIQLYSIRDDMKANPLGTLQKLAKMGYKNVEHANYADRKFYGYSAAEFKKILDDLGLKMPSGHTVLDKLKHWDTAQNDFTDVWKHTIEDAAICGQKYVISPWLDESQRKEASVMKAMMEIFNKSGQLCQRSGMKFGYHNHDFEFSEKLGGETVYDIIMQNTEAQYVSQQLDIGNMVNGGANAIEIIKQYPGRFESMHVKDEILSKKPTEHGKYESTILGKGVVGVKQVVDLAVKMGGTTQLIIEQEAYQGKAPIMAVKKDLEVMQKWGYK